MSDAEGPTCAPPPGVSGAAAGWPAMVLTAGLGTRLRPLSAVRAKPALPVAGVPLAGRILRWLSAAGVGRAVLNLHHMAHTITAAIGDGGAFGTAVRYSWERQVLGSAGGPARALPLLDAERFFIVNGDTLTDVDLEALAAHHVSSGARVTMALITNPDPLHYGGVAVDAGGRVTGFPRPGPQNSGWHFVGVQAVDASVFDGLDPDTPSETVSGIYQRLIAQEPGAVQSCISRATFRDIGTAADYLQTSLALAPADGGPGALVGARTTVESGARVTDSVLWDDVWIGADAELDHCVVADRVRVPAGARFSRRVLVNASEVPAGPDEDIVHGLLAVPLDARRRPGSVGKD
jgi:mannose-1-phosphate guanylyltransferase